jgi:hypothetical protein
VSGLDKKPGLLWKSGLGAAVLNILSKSNRMFLKMAERERFELSVPVTAHTLSKRAPSATRTSLRNSKKTYTSFMGVWQYLFGLSEIPGNVVLSGFRAFHQTPFKPNGRKQ